jgi:hypothetical protein
MIRRIPQVLVSHPSRLCSGLVHFLASNAFLGYIMGNGLLKGIAWDICPTRSVLPHLNHATLPLPPDRVPNVGHGIYAVCVEGLISCPARPHRDG